MAWFGALIAKELGNMSPPVTMVEIVGDKAEKAFNFIEDFGVDEGMAKFHAALTGVWGRRNAREGLIDNFGKILVGIRVGRAGGPTRPAFMGHPFFFCF